MIRTLLTCLLLLAWPLQALADVPQPQYTIVSTTTTTTIQARVFFGVGSTATQTTAVTCYDNNALSGSQLLASTPTPTTAPTATLPPSGVLLSSGFVTCAIATSVVAPGYIIFWSR